MADHAGKIRELQQKANELMLELPPILRSEDMQTFCSVLAPALLQPSDGLREHVDSVFVNGAGKHQAASQPDFDKTLRQFKSWGEASGAIQGVLDQCLEVACSVNDEKSVLGAGNKRIRPSDSPWDVATKGLLWDESPWTGASETVHLISCRRCSRVVLQSRFDAHWEECQHFNYAAGDKSPVNGAGSAMTAKVKLKNQPKVGVPTKFGITNNKFSSVPKSRDLKKRKGEELPLEGELPMEEPYRMVEIEVITCDGCGLSPITGPRYSCNECEDFDLCEECYTRGLPQDVHNPAHTFCQVAIPVVSSGHPPPDGAKDPNKNLPSVSPNKEADAKGPAAQQPKKSFVVDLDRICGVKLETGGRCMRTIDCKAHTQLAKREVLGRSRPYDELLAERKMFKASQQAATLASAGGGGAMSLRPNRERHDEPVEDSSGFVFPSGKKRRVGDGIGKSKEEGAEVDGTRSEGMMRAALFVATLPLMSDVLAACFANRGEAGGSGGPEVPPSKAEDGVMPSGRLVGGGGAPLAMRQLPRRDNALVELFSRKESRDITCPPPPPMPFLGLFSSHPVSAYGDPERSRQTTKKGTKVKSEGDAEGAQAEDSEAVSETAAPPADAPAAFPPSPFGKLGAKAGPGSGTAKSKKSKAAAAKALEAQLPPGMQGPDMGPGMPSPMGPTAGPKGKKGSNGKNMPPGAQQQMQRPNQLPSPQSGMPHPHMGMTGKPGAKGPMPGQQAWPSQRPPDMGQPGAGRGGPGGPNRGPGGRGQPPPPGHPGHRPPGAMPGQGPQPPTQPAAPPPQGQQPLRVRQAFKWAFNLRRKPVDKTLVRGQFSVTLPSGLDVHTAMVVWDPPPVNRVRLGTERDRAPCKPDDHKVEDRRDLLQVVFQRRASNQQATVYVDSVCSRCSQCFFVTDAPPRPPSTGPTPQTPVAGRAPARPPGQMPPGDRPPQMPPQVRS